VLTADLVNARRRGSELRLVSLDDAARARAVALGARLVAVVQAHVGRTWDELEDALDAVDVEPSEYRLKDGLAKLLEDRCELEAQGGPDPQELRRDVFTRASARRAALDAGGKLDRAVLLAEIAAERGWTPDVVERALFADLRGAQLVARFDAPGPETLVASYERGQAQAVLLRAVKVTVDVEVASAGATRALFRRLKFLQLLHVVTRTDAGYRVVIDGPFSLFESVTKYGQRLAMVLPVLEGCDAWKLEADVRWGKEKRPLVFRLEGGAARTAAEEPALPDEVQALVKAFASLETPWRASASTSILELPGVGLTVPDLVFERRDEGGSRRRVYLEVMGYWSRAAVWRRVELVQAGLAEPILFAVSSRLRVSEEVLDADLPGALYVYKGTMSARAIAERLDRMAAPARAAR
jgi:predicted nuclease of restriction endonuclease-like RecB superfamily